MRYLYQNIEQDPARCHSCGLCRRHVWVVLLSIFRPKIRQAHAPIAREVSHSGAQRGIAYKLVLCCALSFYAHYQSDTDVHSFQDTEQGP